MWGIPDYNHETQKYEPKWEKMVDYSPDRNPSLGKVVTGVAGVRVIRVYAVRGLGVIIQAARNEPTEDGKLQFTGMSILTKDELGYGPKHL